MITVTPFDRLGRFENDWLFARYHFSFADYRDPTRMGLGPLRVWNDDTIKSRSGFEMHPHRDMEIVTYVRRGAITHEDGLGNRGVTKAGDVQVMSAGTGIVHSERNQEDEDTTLFQIWITPSVRGLEPRWETRRFPKTSSTSRLTVLASGRAGDEGTGALLIHQDAAVLGGGLAAGHEITHTLENGRVIYLVPDRGAVTVNGRRAEPRAGVSVAGETMVKIRAIEDAEIVAVDVTAA